MPHWPGRPRWLRVHPQASADVSELHRIQVVVDFLFVLTVAWVCTAVFAGLGLSTAFFWEEVAWVVCFMVVTALGVSRHARVALPISLVIMLFVFGALRTYVLDMSRTADVSLFTLQMMRALVINPTMCSFTVSLDQLVGIMGAEIAWVVGVSLKTLPPDVVGPVLRETLFAITLFYCLLYMAIHLQRKSEQEARISARKLEKARDEALDVARLKSQFVATVSHEFRTPLNGVLGLSQLLLDTPLLPVQREWVRRVHASGTLLLSLANQVLDLVRLESGKVQPTREPFDLAALLEQVASVCGVTARSGVEILCRLHAGVPQQLVGDPLRLQQVLINLVGNAIKFTEHGAIRVEVFATCVLPETEADEPSADELATGGGAPVRLCFVVADSGPGMPPELLQRLFQPFVQGQHGRGGAGLGLSIAQQLVRTMHGSISVHSELGRGTAFYFEVEPRLPGAGWLAVAAGTPRGDRPGAAVVLAHTAELARFCTEVLRPSGLPVQTHVVDPDAAEAELCLAVRDAVTALPSPLSATAPDVCVLADGARLAHTVSVLAPSLPVDVRAVALLRPQESREFDVGAPAGTRTGTTQVVYKPLVSTALLAAVRAAQAGIHCLSRTTSAASSDRSSPLAVQESVGPSGGETPSEDGFGLMAPAPAAAAAAAAAAPDSARRGSLSGASPSSALHILLADDVEINQMLLRVMLNRLGATVEVVSDGAAAVQAVARHAPGHYALCLMDVQMPVMDGLAATRAIRQLERDQGRRQPLRIVALTAEVREAELQACVAAGMQGWVTKPVQMDELRRAVLQIE